MPSLVLLHFFLPAVHHSPSFTDRLLRELRRAETQYNESAISETKKNFLHLLLPSCLGFFLLPSYTSVLEWYKGVKPQEEILAPKLPSEAHFVPTVLK